MSCIAPFLPESNYNNSRGFVEGRFCSTLTGVSCCLPCPITEWVYPDSFQTLGTAVGWIAVVSAVFCAALLLSWAVLPVDKTLRHYLSICLTSAVVLMNLGFIIPLAGQPVQCVDPITPNSMHSSSMCAASGVFLILGGWAGIMWVFLRSLSLHLQICWQVVVGRRFMWLSHAAGWGLPVLGTVLAVVFSGVSFRFGATCHVNHSNSLADLWIPLLVFAGLTIVVQLVTFAYCIKVYLAALADNTASTENSGLPSYTNSIHTLTPRQAYRRVRRVIQLQWRGIAIVLIIVTDVIFFSVVFVFQDHTTLALKDDPARATEWLLCLVRTKGDKTPCLDLASAFAVNEATVGAVLVLLSMNGIWLLFLLGRWSMVLGWVDLLTPASRRDNHREFVSVDARLEDLKKDPRSYEMLSRDRDGGGGGGGGGGGILAGGSTATTAGTTASHPSFASDNKNARVTSFSSSFAGVLSATTTTTAPTTGGAASAAAAAAAAPLGSHNNNNKDSWSMIQSPSAMVASSPSPSGGGGSSAAAYYADAAAMARAASPPVSLQSLSRQTSPPPPQAVRSVSRTSHTSHASHARYGSRSASQDRLGSLTNNTTAAAAATNNGGRRTPDYFVQTARYNAPARSFSIPRPSTASSATGPASAPPPPPGGGSSSSSNARFEDRHPLGMNRI